MNINCNICINNTTIEFNIEPYMGRFNDFMKEVYTKFNLSSPIEISEIQIPNTEYFNSITDVKHFLSITFSYGYLPHIFLEWANHNKQPLNQINKFNTQYQGVFVEPWIDFSKQYIKKYHPIPEFIQDSIDYAKLWNKHLNKDFYTLKVKDSQIHGITSYHYAVFSYA
jgi:hypothetical protein